MFIQVGRATRLCLQMRSLEPQDSGHNYPHGAVALAEFLVAGGQAAVLLTAVEEALHLTPQPVQRAVKGTRPVLVGLTGNGDPNAPSAGCGADGVAAVALVA